MKQISKDLRRTSIPDIKEETHKEDFFSSINFVLNAYANLNEKVGYVQGMNIIVSSILYNICNGDYGFLSTYEEECFWLFVSLLERYEMKYCYYKSMKKVFELSNSLEFCLQRNQAVVFDHINSNDVG